MKRGNFLAMIGAAFAMPRVPLPLPTPVAAEPIHFVLEPFVVRTAWYPGNYVRPDVLLVSPADYENVKRILCAD